MTNETEEVSWSRTFGRLALEVLSVIILTVIIVKHEWNWWTFFGLLFTYFIIFVLYRDEQQ